MKTCTGCQRELPDAAFYRDIHLCDGLATRCKECKDKSHTSNSRRALSRAHAEMDRGIRPLSPMILELRLEEEHLMERLALVRRRLVKLGAAIAALLLTCTLSMCTSAPPPLFEVELARLQSTAPANTIDLANVISQAAYAVLEPGYIGTGPAPIMAPPRGQFGQANGRCVSTDGGSPILMMAGGLPSQGRRFRLIAWSPSGAVQSLQIGINANALPDGTPLPQPVRGAPGCLWELNPVSSTLLAPGRAEFDLILPPNSSGATVFFQLSSLLPGANAAGVLTSRLYRMVIGP